jgi:hypothetical protein
MKICLLLIFLFNWNTCFSQTADKMQKGGRGHKLRLNDSLIERLHQFKDSSVKALSQAGSSQIRIDVSGNMDSFLQMQKEQNAKQKKGAIIRIAIGIAFLVLLIIGLKRRKK